MAEPRQRLNFIQQAQQTLNKPVPASSGGGWTPSNVIFHDYGGTPKNKDGVFNPYHALVFPDGSVRYRDPSNPYGVKAPHAYKMNPYSVGLSYADQVGGKPTAEGMATLQREYEAIRKLYPGIKGLGHGEAYHQTRGTDRQASRDGRQMNEASWRSALGYTTPSATAGPTPPTIMQQARDPGYTKNTRSIAQPSSITPGAMSMPQTNTTVMSDKNSGGSLTLPNFGYPGAAENGWSVGSSPSVNGAGASGERVLNPSSGMMDNRLAPAADAPSTSGPMGAGYRDQPPRPAPGASPSPVAQSQQPPSSNGGAQWVNGTYGPGIQWSNGDTSFTRGPGNFAAGTLTDKPAPAPSGGGLAGSGVSTSQAPAANWFKGLFGG